MRRFSVITTERSLQCASVIFGVCVLSMGASLASAQARDERNAQTVASRAQNPQSKRVVLLLPTDQPLLRRAAQTVRDGVRAVAAKTGTAIEVRDCGYGAGVLGGSGVDAVAQAYTRCVNEDTDAVIGPLGRSDVAALVNTQLLLAKPTLLLSPVGATPPNNFYVLAPDLESEAEAIAKQSLEDACRKPMLIGATGATSTRIAATIAAHYRGGGVATPLAQHEFSARDRWQRVAEAWRRDGVDCAFFTGSSATLFELRPFLRGITVYITSASYETELDRMVDWTGVRIADAPYVLDANRAEFANFAPVDSLSPTLARLYALGLDAARIMFEAVLSSRSIEPASAILALRDPRESTGANAADPNVKPTETFDGAIGQLRLRDGQYIRTPAIGEFRGRVPSALGL
jgi:outer membrane PBP1 activator LpoA protein